MSAASWQARTLASMLALFLFALCFGQTPVLRFLLGLLVGLPGFVLLYRYRASLAERPLLLALALWLGWCLLSVGWAPNLRQSLRSVIEEAWLPAGCFLAAAWLVRSPGALRRIGLGALAGLLVLFVMTAWIYYQSGWESLIWRTGRSPLLIPYPGAGVVLSHFLMALPFVLLAARQRLAGWPLLLAFVAIVLLVGLYSSIRMYWLALLLLLAVAVWAYSAEIRARLGRGFWPLVLLAAALLLGLLAYSINQRAANRQGIVDQVAQMVEHDSRWQGWQFWLGKGLQRPLAGVGFGKRALNEALSAEEKSRIEAFEPLLKAHPHNYFITVFVSTGGVGLLLNLALLGVLAQGFLRCRRHGHAAARDAAIAGLLLLIAMLAKNATDDQFSNAVPYYFWSLLGLAYGLSRAAPATLPDGSDTAMKAQA